MNKSFSRCKENMLSNYDSQIKIVVKKESVFKFPTEQAAQERWIAALPNILTTKVTRDVAVCALHWPTGYPTVTAPDGKKRPRHPTSVFELLDSCLRQTTPAAPREIERRMLDSESRARNQLRNLEQADKITAWPDLKRFCKKLEGIIVRDVRDVRDCLRCNLFVVQVILI